MAQTILLTQLVDGLLEFFEMFDGHNAVLVRIGISGIGDDTFPILAKSF